MAKTRTTTGIDLTGFEQKMSMHVDPEFIFLSALTRCISFFQHNNDNTNRRDNRIYRTRKKIACLSSRDFLTCFITKTTGYPRT